VTLNFNPAANADAKPGVPYYGADFYQALNTGLQGPALRQRLNLILKSPHMPHQNSWDTIGCQNGACYQHTALGYNRARQFLLGEFYLMKLTDGRFGVRDLYCDHDSKPEDYVNGDLPGPGQIPDGNIVNTEHTWPQSRFTGRYPNEMQKSDLHHLFPTNNKMNSVRGSFPFGKVVSEVQKLNCSNVHFGVTDQGESHAFEPPDSHKGNVARALFYFSVRYEMNIDARQEKTLRLWNKQDPVDAEEARLNNRIFEVQHSRNPFIDHPELADRISDF
jgi:hypothetical protein